MNFYLVKNFVQKDGINFMFIGLTSCCLYAKLRVHVFVFVAVTAEVERSGLLQIIAKAAGAGWNVRDGGCIKASLPLKTNVLTGQSILSWPKLCRQKKKEKRGMRELAYFWLLYLFVTPLVFLLSREMGSVVFTRIFYQKFQSMWVVVNIFIPSCGP